MTEIRGLPCGHQLCMHSSARKRPLGGVLFIVFLTHHFFHLLITFHTHLIFASLHSEFEMKEKKWASEAS